MAATATTVSNAFEIFMRDTVNLTAAGVTLARASRDWLTQQVGEFPTRDGRFPRLWSEMDLQFGSFARRTKIQPLDDIDQMFCLMGEGAYYTDLGSRVEITVPEGSSSNLRYYVHDETRLLNSRRVVNAFVSNASDVPQYSSAEIGRNGEAATINLKSYPWSFDVVPAFYTEPERNGREYYIVPDGAGHWKKSDPRIVAREITSANQRHSGYMLDLVRIGKYWNRRKTAPQMPSLMFEVIALNHCKALSSTLSVCVDLNIEALFRTIGIAVWNSVPDPAGIQGDLNTLDIGTRFSVSERAQLDAGKAAEARCLEDEGDYARSIAKWREIFGPEFPSHE